ncbi:MAG TPA: glycosyltransferase family 2 protein [Thermoanaerobaculia bacterium]|nr:glycosyltransferase family 2 protein [Thermoanaerobaculia bacterium]HUM28840.1 glycosyltransferase family 2 protein [Thermoanaerobaculia bacterium]HXK67226.1 glycosyltransferase family 2 protein [Thermoanaerobaculia bacterium]
MVTVIVVSHNSREDLKICLDSIAKQKVVPERVIVVDSASDDDSVDVALGSGVEAMGLCENLGFGGAFNRALPAVRTPWILLMNPDIRLDAHFLKEVYRAIQRNESKPIASIQGKLLRAEGPELTPTPFLDSTGIHFTPSLRHLDRGSGEEDQGQFEEENFIFGPTGACAIYRTSALMEIGGFDEDFFMYREDADLAWRLQWAGYSCLYLPSARAWHRRRVLPERRRNLPAWINYHSVKNRFLLRLNNQTLSHFILTLPLSLPRDLGIILYCLLRERSSLKAYPYVVKNLSRLYRKRRAFLSRRKIPTRSILPWFWGRKCVSPS